LTTALGPVNTRLDVMQADIASLRTDVTGLKTDVATLKTDVAILKTDVATLKTDVATLKTDVATLKTDVTTLKTDVTTLKTDVATMRANITSLEHSVDTRFGVMQIEMENMKQTIEAVKTSQIRVELEQYPRIAASLDFSQVNKEKSEQHEGRIVSLENRVDVHDLRITGLELAEAK